METSNTPLAHAHWRAPPANRNLGTLRQGVPQLHRKLLAAVSEAAPGKEAACRRALGWVPASALPTGFRIGRLGQESGRVGLKIQSGEVWHGSLDHRNVPETLREGLTAPLRPRPPAKGPCLGLQTQGPLLLSAALWRRWKERQSRKRSQRQRRPHPELVSPDAGSCGGSIPEDFPRRMSRHAR
ncbi:hypothetical protein P7K49_036277 [Saguinus oedipus]|uniref:Uncharacterized protein n=1 Tax=Saguinus oedipus TaxID=9490 RepID=A0ABQ9TJM8_SAGOE|nr:hypothetical protein P7K49_036277 [Saguinus oedipus]